MKNVECRMGRLVGCGPAKRGSWIGFLVAALSIVGAIDDVRAQPSSGACCLPNGTCTVTNDPFVCRDQNGIFRGDATCTGVICTGACCLPNGSCTSGSPQSCTSAAGEFKGYGSLCGNQVCGGACCLVDKSCADTGPGNCTSLNGLFQGLGTLCQDDCPSRLTTAFTYQGQLKLGGMPLADTVNLEFSLWPLAIGGTQLGSTQSFSNVEVVNGLLQVELDFGPIAFQGNSRWLQIVVDGTPLSPRQTLTAAPYAIRALSAGNGHALDAVDGSPTQAVSVDNDGNVGIGTVAPNARLHVKKEPVFPGGTLALEGTTHTYLSFFPAGVGSGRDGYLGFASATSYDITLANEIPGGSINLLPGPSGVVKIGTKYATSGEENLRIIRGTVDEAGNVVSGSGFTVDHPTHYDGYYYITFDVPFAAPPSVTATKDSAAYSSNWVFAMINTLAENRVTITLRSPEEALFMNAPFHFIAVGPR